MRTNVSSDNRVTKFQKEVNRTYVREGRFAPFIGSTSNAVIQVNREIKRTSIPLIGALDGAGVRGSQQLSGSEEALANYAMTFTPSYLRNGVVIDDEEREKSAFDLFTESRPALMAWMMETKRDQIIQALNGVMANHKYCNYGGSSATGATDSVAASDADQDEWQRVNSDRIIYGSSRSNLTLGDHSTSLGNIDTTADKLTPSVISLVKRAAMNCRPLIRPVMIENDSPHFVYFCGSYAFRDLRESTAMVNALREAMPRLQSNPLWSGGDLYWDGVIIREFPEIDNFIDDKNGSRLWSGIWGDNAKANSLVKAGASSSRVGVGFLCGAQAVCFGRGIEASFRTSKEDDYGHKHGVAITAKHDIKKFYYNGKQHGVVTHFHSSALDA